MAYTLLKNKPYGFVPLVEATERQPVAGHHTLRRDRYSGRLILELEVLTPVHVSVGRYRLAGNGRGLVGCMASRGGRPVVPGSSVKGVVRSVAEAVSPSCTPRLPNGERSLEAALPANNRSSCNGENGTVCVTCRLFGYSVGSRSYRGQVGFGEFAPPSGREVRIEIHSIPPLNEPFRTYPRNNPPFRGKYGNERLYYCRLCQDEPHDCATCTKDDYLARLRRAGPARPVRFRGRKFYYHSRQREESPGNRYRPYECLPAGARLTGAVFFTNLTRSELSLLAFSLGLDGSFALKLGYGKPAYFGSIRFHLCGVEWLAGRYGLPAGEHPDIQELAGLYPQEVAPDLQQRISILREILDWEHPQGRPWPTVQGNKIY